MSQLQNDILAGLKKFGFQLTKTMTYCYGKEFGPAIKALHAAGLVRRVRNGWEAV